MPAAENDADESVSKDIVGHKPKRLKDTIKHYKTL